MNDAVVAPGQRRRGQAFTVPPQVAPLAGRLEALPRGGAQRLDELADRRRVISLARLVGRTRLVGEPVERVAVDQRLPVVPEGRCPIEEVEAEEPLAEVDGDAHRLRRQFEGDAELCKVRLPLLVDVAHRHRGRRRSQHLSHPRDVVPDLGLIRPVPLLRAKRAVDFRGLAAPARARRESARGEPAAPVPPPPRLHTADGNDDLVVGRDEDIGVEDPVLLGTDELLPVDEQEPVIQIVGDLDVRHAATLIDLRDLHLPGRLGIQQAIRGIVDGWADQRHDPNRPVRARFGLLDLLPEL